MNVKMPEGHRNAHDLGQRIGSPGWCQIDYYALSFDEEITTSYAGFPSLFSNMNQHRTSIMELTLWVEQRDSDQVGGNARGALVTISKNEEFINMTLAVLMTPE